MGLLSRYIYDCKKFYNRNYYLIMIVKFLQSELLLYDLEKLSKSLQIEGTYAGNVARFHLNFN